ncbi:3'-5' exonuclease family protein [Neisseria animalis]|uniref:DNA-directed DNA polymerase n=1 Tax=Neisseria animalis TaxID=492 RepID=A0A5P3MRG4_NEIAN|nr:3'-5' exonuclease family protein [Neisseria animalis]QEY24196.1 3'-5' exonuclease [Neisseria animalis]ROW32194.1 3'-5' exonuclease [Neisseria animalis]VEE06494.1 DNA polymerase III subunit [Neisseria animalis]
MAHNSRWPKLAAASARFGLPVAVVDLETTGGNFQQDRITEVAIMRFEQGKAKRYEWLVNPQQPISPFIENLTGINDAMVADAPCFQQLAPSLLPLLRGALLIAHNSRFDHTFLRNEFQRAGIPFSAPALCTVQLSRRLYPQFHKHNLDSIIERFQISAEQRHRAMTDVLALCDFLEHSLQEKNSTDWENQCRALMNPKMLPTWLPDALAQQLYALPDSEGVLVWLDTFGQAQAVEAHNRAYSETASLLHSKKVPPYMQSAASVRFLPALGSLHTLWLKAQAMQEYRIMPSESLRTFSTVHFAPDEHGALQARIVPLKNGSRPVRPYGFFLHKKAAKRALSEWAHTHQLCPDTLNILPTNHAKGVPCPVQAVGQCNGACQTADGISRQNERIRELAVLLPVADWGHAHAIEITESNPVSGNSLTFTCAGGALSLPDGSWYFDETLPGILKSKFKQGREAVRIIA